MDFTHSVALLGSQASSWYSSLSPLGEQQQQAPVEESCLLLQLLHFPMSLCLGTVWGLLLKP